MIEKYVNADELKRLLGSLAVVLVVIAIAGLFATIVVPGLRNANQPGTPVRVSTPIGEPGWLDPGEYPPQQSRIIPPVDPQTLLHPSPELLSRGKALFAQNCSQCHGETGRGDGMGAANMNPRPRNFSDASGWKNGSDLPAIYRTLADGIKNSSMTSFNFLSRRDRMALAHYVQSLGSFPHGTGSEESAAALTKELATPGEKTPNKIPVSMAMAKLQNEYHPPAPFGPGAAGTDEEARLLRRIIVDEQRAAATILGAAGHWTSLKELTHSLVSNAPGNGFSTDIAALGPSEWKMLQEAIRKRFAHEASLRP